LIMTKVFPGIYWFKLPSLVDGNGPAYINAYLVRGEKGYLLVDSGWNTEESFNALKKGLGEIGAEIKEISQIIVTHVHPDHYGMAGRLKKLTGATIAMHHVEIDSIQSRYVDMEELLQQTDHMLIANGVPYKEMTELRDSTIGLEHYVSPTPPDIVLHNGDIIEHSPFTFRVIWAPGHSSGHICLYEYDKKILFSGDHILPKITPNISVHPQSIENPLGRYIESLKEIRKLDVELTLPGHDQPFKNLKQRIDEIIYHHGLRNLEILAMITSREKTAFQIAQEITWGENSGWNDLPPFHKRMAAFETLAHLEMMAAENRVNKLARKGVTYYVKK
jgi:glyoxylase-like metal-dependent hydrolase (beta-lactamase superfamily II)